MKILLVTQEPPLSSEEVVSGNSVRTMQLRTALESAGHQVIQVWLATGRNGSEEHPGLTFRNQDQLHGILMSQAPEAVIVGYWELLRLLPFENSMPVVLDFVAPRTLEELYESPQTVKESLRRLKNNLGKCDLVLVGNRLQRHLLINNLIEAGIDLRGPDPIREVPLGATFTRTPRSDPEKSGWLLVSGGVSWPWRNTGSYQAVLEKYAKAHDPGFRLVHFGGGYRWHENEAVPSHPADGMESSPVQFQALKPYRQFSDFLTGNAHIGVELAEWNIEREYSQSFRSLEFLRHGMPLLCNRYLPISRLVEAYDAGWIVDEPATLGSLLDQITRHPDQWLTKSENAQRLVDESLQPIHSVKPLLDWLENPLKATRLQPVPANQDQVPVLGVPPLKERIGRQFNLIRRVLLNRIFGEERGPGVLIVTRGDLFPPDHGAAVRTVETVRALVRQGMRVGIITDCRKHWFEAKADGFVEKKYPFWLRFLSLPGPVSKLLHFTKNLPYSNSFLYLPLTDGSFLWRILAAARTLDAGVLQAEFPAYALPCIRARNYFDCAVVMVEHNVEYDRMKAQVPELTAEHYQNLKQIEIGLCNRVNAVVCVSENDRQILGDDGVDPNLLHTVPHGVNLDHFDEANTEDVRGQFGIPPQSPILIYHGTFSYPPNQEALRIFAEILLPGLEEQGLECHLLAVGKYPPATSLHPRIHLSGSVEQVEPWLKAADIAVVPLVDGGGTRMKIIDYFAARLPVISTSKGIEGIPVIAGKQALVVDEWDAVIAAVVELVEHPQKAQTLARAGRELANRMDWNTAADKYQEIYAALN